MAVLIIFLAKSQEVPEDGQDWDYLWGKDVEIFCKKTKIMFDWGTVLYTNINIGMQNKVARKGK